MDLKLESVEYNLPNAVASTLHEPLTKSESKVFANLNVQQQIIQDTINNTSFHELVIKQEKVELKDELLESCAASESFLEKQLLCRASVYEDKTAGKCDLVNHTHTGEKPYACSICDYKAAQKLLLMNHMKMHTGEKIYSCFICKYGAALKYTLVKHMRTHTREKPYSCSMCSYKAAHKCVLMNHMKTHTGEKPYSCTVCEFKAARKSTLVRHMNTHTK